MRTPSKSKSREPRPADQEFRGKSPAPSQTLTDAAARLLAALGLSADRVARSPDKER